MKAKAAVTRENARGMVITEYLVPDPGSEEVLIRVAMASLCGSDLHMWRGEVPWFQRAPGIQGHEMTGMVARLGASLHHYVATGGGDAIQLHLYAAGRIAVELEGGLAGVAERAHLDRSRYGYR